MHGPHAMAVGDDMGDVEEPLLPVEEDGSFKNKRRKSWMRSAGLASNGKGARSCRRGGCGCCHGRRGRILLFVVVAVVLLLLIAFAVVQWQLPRIAATAIAGTGMEIQRMALTAPHKSSVELGIKMHIHSPSMFPAELAATNFTIYFQDEEVGVFPAPAMPIHHGDNAVEFPAATLRVTNHSAWNAFARELMQSAEVVYAIHGHITMHVKLLAGLIRLTASDISLVKELRSTGMSGLKRMKIADIDMSESTQTQVLATIKTCLYNPSPVTIDPVGTLCMEAHYPTVSKTSHVAHLVSTDVVSITSTRDDPSNPFCAALSDDETDMKVGYNLLELRGEMLGTNPEAISGLISKYLGGISAEMTVVACHPTATSVDLFNEAMLDLSIPAALPPRSDALVGRMFFKSIHLDAPEEGSENEYIGLTTGVTVEASSPLGPKSTLTLDEVHMKVGLYAAAQDHKEEDEYLGDLTTLQVNVTEGRIVEVSNVTVQCAARLELEGRGTAFGSFVRSSVLKNQVGLRLKGIMDVVAVGALGRLDLKGLSLDVDTVLAGMRNFDRVSIDAFTLPGTPAAEPSGEVLSTKITLWNPSLFSVAIGTVGMQLALADHGDDDDKYHLGKISGAMNLHTGKNSLELSGRLRPHWDRQGRVSDSVAEFFSRFLRGEASPVIVTISDVQYPNCIWMRDALVGLQIKTPVPGVVAGFQLITNLKMRELDVELSSQKTSPESALLAASNTLMRVRTDLSATVKMPDSIAIPLGISNVSVDLMLQDSAHTSIGKLVSKREVCQFDQAQGGAFHLNMSRFYPISFEDDNGEVKAMSRFITDLLTKSGNVTLRLNSRANAGEGASPYVDTRMGMLPLSGIPILGAPQIPAMNSFRDPPVKILEVDILSGSANSMELMMAFEIKNPSIVTTALGKLVLDVYSSGSLMGQAAIADFKLDCCGKATTLRGSFTFQPDTDDRSAAIRFLSNFVSGYFTAGKPQEITISGSASSTPLDILQPALSSLEIPASLPTLSDLFPATPTLVTSSLLYTPSILHLLSIPTSLELQNPFSEQITVTRVDLLLYPCKEQAKENDKLVCHTYYAEPLAHFAPTTFTPIYIPANSKGCSSCCQGSRCDTKTTLCPHASVEKCMSATVESLISAEAIAALFHTATTGLFMSVNGTIEASIGEYKTDLMYRQDGLLVKLA